MRLVLLAIGWVSLGLGAVGLFVPVLPTTPFVLLSAACFLRSSERLHRWLVDHPVFGVHIEEYLAGRGLTRKTKIVALSTLWGSVLLSTILFVPLLVADLIIYGIAIAVTIYILRLPTCPTASCELDDMPDVEETGD
jgi:uncharacterized membrane protein YbaN (DUF454 family)